MKQSEAMIQFTKHAELKFAVLRKHGCKVTSAQVILAVEHPDSLDYSRTPLVIAQISIDDTHVLRVVYKQIDRIKKIITFYPGRKKQYAKKG